jgi:hypothetical protein
MLTWVAPKLDFRVPGQPRGAPPTGSTWSRMAAIPHALHCTPQYNTGSLQCSAVPAPASQHSELALCSHWT